eukprot:gene7090-427_t
MLIVIATALALCFIACKAASLKSAKPLVLKFDSKDSRRLCSLISVEGFSTVLIKNASAQGSDGKIALPEFNATSATFNPQSLETCPEISETAPVSISLLTVLTLAEPSVQANLSLSFESVPDNSDDGANVILRHAIMQPFNVKVNQTKPLPKKGYSYELCQFQKDQQDHTLAFSIAAAVGVLCFGSIVIYVFRSRRKASYTVLD